MAVWYVGTVYPTIGPFCVLKVDIILADIQRYRMLKILFLQQDSPNSVAMLACENTSASSGNRARAARAIVKHSVLAAKGDGLLVAS